MKDGRYWVLRGLQERKESSEMWLEKYKNAVRSNEKCIEKMEKYNEHGLANRYKFFRHFHQEKVDRLRIELAWINAELNWRLSNAW